MKLQMKELQKLHGVGEVLSRRLVEAGLHNCERIVVAGEDGLRMVKGINPRMIQGILAQAAEMSGTARAGRTERIAQLKKAAQEMKSGLEARVGEQRDQLGDELAGEGRKLEKQFLKTLTVLEEFEGQLETKVKKAGKGMVRAERTLARMTEQGTNKVVRSLKKARKFL